jgi:galactoside 2-L-fucosyltransferase 1/2
MQPAIKLATGIQAQIKGRKQTVPAKKTQLFMNSQFRGRLGNMMFQYAVAFAITRNNSLWKACMDPTRYSTMTNLFVDSLSLPSCQMPLLKKKNIPESRLHAYVTQKTLPHTNITLDGYFQSHTYFTHSKTELRKEFTIPSRIKPNVLNYFRNITPVEWTNKSYIRVGIHVRRGDMLSSFLRRKGVIPCTIQYFKHAQQYFKKRYERVQFIIVSADLAWCKKNITGKHVVYTNYDYTMDFAILTLCDHIITSIGTFSWWAGWLCKGTTIYYDVKPPAGTYMEHIMANNKWIPPDDEFNRWIPIV